MNKKKAQKINIKRRRRIKRIRKSIITMILLGVVLGLMVYIPINIKEKNLIASEVVASEKFKDDINVLETFNRLREDSKSIYASDEVIIKINSKIEEILEELKNGGADKFKELVDNLNSLIVDVSAGNHSELEDLFNQLNEDKMTGFAEAETKKVNTLMDEYKLLIKDKRYNEAKVNLENINTYVEEVKKVVEKRTTKAEYDKKSAEDENNRKATYINGILLVNKKNGLPNSFGKGENLEAREAFEEMKKVAEKDGLYINAFSTYRSFLTQDRLYWNYVASSGKESTDTFSARPGFSEHQTGLGFDIGGADKSFWANQEFQYTAEAEWLKNNCYKYGFILRYPEGKEWKTGFVYESWHFRYLGKEHSKNFNNNNLTLEEYLGM